MTSTTTLTSTPTLTSTVDPASFKRLLDRWNTHQDLRRAGAPVSRLARSRVELDEARHDVRHELHHAA